MEPSYAKSPASSATPLTYMYVAADTFIPSSTPRLTATINMVTGFLDILNRVIIDSPSKRQAISWTSVELLHKNVF